MRKIIGKIRTFYSSCDEGDHTAGYSKILIIILICWAAMWIILPCIALNNDFIDVLENIVWGRHWDAGYDKDPYLGAWLGYSVWIASGKSFFSSFLFSQICVGAGIFSVWLVAKRILPQRTAFLASVTLLAVNFYGIKSVELCDDVMELGFWPLTMLFTYLSVRGDEKKKPLYCFLAGLFAGASLMVKYFAPAMFVSLGIPLLFTAEGRKVIRKPYFYLFLVPFLPMILPNLIWQIDHHGKTFSYITERAGLDASIPWIEHILHPLSAVNRAAGVLAVALMFFNLLFLLPCRKADRVSYSAFDRVFVTSCCWGSFASALLFSLITGGKINYSWVVPCFPYFGVWLFMIWQPPVNKMRARLYTAMILVMGIVFGIVFTSRSTEHQGYRKDGYDYENMPGKRMASSAEAIWRNHAEGTVPFVVGNRECACNVAVYSEDKPEAFFEADPTQSAWINPQDVKKLGCILVWEGTPQDIHKDLAAFRTQFPEERLTETTCLYLERAVPEWYRKLRGPAPQHPFCFQVIKPE